MRTNEEIDPGGYWRHYAHGAVDFVWSRAHVGMPVLLSFNRRLPCCNIIPLTKKDVH